MVQRYDPAVFYDNVGMPYGEMVTAKSGDYVLYENYVAIERERDELLQKVQELETERDGFRNGQTQMQDMMKEGR